MFVWTQAARRDRGPAIRLRRGIPAGRDDPWPVVGVGAGVEVDDRLAGEQTAIGVGRGPHRDDRAVAARRRHRLVHAVHDADGSSGLARIATVTGSIFV